MKETIASAANTLVPAYLALKEKGYRVSVTKDAAHQENWLAESDTVRLMAEDALTLLGLASMFETRNPNWKASDKEIDDFEKKFLTDRP